MTNIDQRMKRMRARLDALESPTKGFTANDLLAAVKSGKPIEISERELNKIIRSMDTETLKEWRKILSAMVGK